jgi:hypothetical protein
MVGGPFIDLLALLVNGRGNALLYGCHHPVADLDFSTNAKLHPIFGSVVPSRTRLAVSQQDLPRWPARSLHLPQFPCLDTQLGFSDGITRGAIPPLRPYALGDKSTKHRR